MNMIMSVEKIKRDIQERIDANYSCSFNFYHGYICALYSANIIKMRKEYEELKDWIESLDLN